MKKLSKLIGAILTVAAGVPLVGYLVKKENVEDYSLADRVEALQNSGLIEAEHRADDGPTFYDYFDNDPFINHWYNNVD